jgi:hypothetical protein
VYKRWRYTALLVSLLCLVVFHPLTADLAVGRRLYYVLLTLVFVAAFLQVYQRRAFRTAAVVLGLPTLIANWTAFAFPDLPPAPLAVALHLLAALFLGLAVTAILRDVNEAKAITLDSLCGAFAGYLLVAVIFYHLFYMLEAVWPGSFQGGPDVLKELADPDGRRSVLAYYSIVTMTTVGYGDVVPASNAARMLACLEALAGQFYIAVILAELIGLKASQGGGGHGGAIPGRERAG